MKTDKVNLSVTQIATLLGMARSSIYRYIETGEIVRGPDGLISLDRLENRRFLKGQGIDLKKIAIPKIPLPGRKPSGAAPAPRTAPDTGRAELQRLHLIAKIRKLDLENDVRRGKLIEAEAVRTSIFFYLDRLHSGLERLAGAFLDDVAAGIVREGLTANIRADWKNRILGEIDTAKNEAVSRLEKLSKGGAHEKNSI